MGYKRISVKSQQYNSGEWRRLQELEDLIEKAEQGDAKNLKKENALWAYEMAIGSLEKEVESLKKQISEITAKTVLRKNQ